MIAYRKDIDGIRAVAILAVVVFHAWPNILYGGFVGVDIFFVISGYLISLVIFSSEKKGLAFLCNFYLRRIRRLFPALLVVLLFLLAAGWFVLLADEYSQLGRHVTAGSLFFANLAFWREAGYFDIQSELKPLLHLWSLGIEEQYYLGWPLFIMLFWRSRALLLLLMVASTLLSFGASILLARDHGTAAFYLPFTRAWELFAGGMLAWAVYGGVLKREVFWSRGRDLASVAGALLVAAAVFLFDPTLPFPSWRAAIPVLGTMLLIAAGPDALVNRYVLSAKPMVMLGLISYPLYLWHWPLLSLARILDARDPSPVFAGVVVATAIVLATATYLLVERPVRSMAISSSVPLLGGLMGVVALAGVVVAAQDGFPKRVQVYEDQVAQIRWAREVDPACKDALAVQSRYCRITDASRAPTAVIIGDSHANRLFDGLSPLFAEYRGNLIQLGEGGCLPFWHLEGGAIGSGDTCRTRMDGQLNYIVANTAIRTVILTARGPLYISGVGFGEVEKSTQTFLARPGVPDSVGYGELYLRAMRETVARLLTAGKRVVFVIDNPELGFNPLSCVELRPVQLLADLRNPCAISRPRVDVRNQQYLDIVAKVAAEFPELIVVSAQDALCDAHYCWAVRDGELLYMDGDHLNRAGTRLVAQSMPYSVFQ